MFPIKYSKQKQYRTKQSKTLIKFYYKLLRILLLLLYIKVGFKQTNSSDGLSNMSGNENEFSSDALL